MADRKFAFGQKSALVVQYITEAKGQGITAAALAELLDSSVPSVSHMVRRAVRNDGFPCVSVPRAGVYRYYLAEFAPSGKRQPPKPKPPEDIGKRVLLLISRPHGASNLEMRSAFAVSRRPEALRILADLVAEGRARPFYRYRPAVRPEERFFSDFAQGSAWAGTAKHKSHAQRKQPAPSLRASGQPWQPPQPKPQQPAIIPPNVKRTVQLMPAYDARYQCEPGMRVVGGFATLGPGRYLDDRRAA